MTRSFIKATPIVPDRRGFCGASWAAWLVSWAALVACSLSDATPALHEPVGVTLEPPRAEEPPAPVAAAAPPPANTDLPSGTRASDEAVTAASGRTGQEAEASGAPNSAHGQLCNFSGPPPKRIFFATDETSLRGRGKQILEDLLACDQADLLGSGQIRLTGFADPRGTAAENRSLALARAQAVKRYLVRRGMAAERIATLSEGATEHQGSSPEGWAYDRRVQVQLAPAATEHREGNGLPDRGLSGH